MYDPELNSPGCWFVAPYAGLNGEQSDQSWIGPFIYDGRNAELIWSGAAMFNSNVADFRISNVNGEPLITLFANNGINVLNNDFTMRMHLNPEEEGRLNTHELSFVDNGTRAIFIKNGRQNAPSRSCRIWDIAENASPILMGSTNWTSPVTGGHECMIGARTIALVLTRVHSYLLNAKAGTTCMPTQ
ncbi:hypothetical protein KC320_g9353 [Hortaea werneckii]|nr:hypothetical protein KC320_g9353 [Hortaea werneckii]